MDLVIILCNEEYCISFIINFIHLYVSAYPVREKFILLNQYNEDSTPTPDGSLVYLDRQSIYCGEGYFMKGFTFNFKQKITSWNNDFFLRYGCALYSTVPYDSARDCRELNTGWNAPGKDMNYLDRHEMKCNADEGLVGFHGKTDYTDKSSPKFRF